MSKKTLYNGVRLILPRYSFVSIQEIRHPLIRHKLGLLRRSDISTKNFRELAQEVLGTNI